MPKLNDQCLETGETWIQAIKRAVRSRPESNIRQTIALTPENVLTLIYDAQQKMLETLKECEKDITRFHKEGDSPEDIESLVKEMIRPRFDHLLEQIRDAIKTDAEATA